ncbi:MAG: DUF2283 domain-containing protein [Magnetococcales bacterium]|nr:DUF2283 domain-containing protein [Magnetococcales bacterium]
MRIRVDARSDAIYLDLTQESVESSEEVADGVILDYDANGRLVGIEVLEASKKSRDENALQRLAVEMGNAA